ncbi:MAG: PEGA domain-containing protein [Planctomycetota bacterium]|nr:MAG: PEGA domain-containing protein [Planctomycetota bacterium]
MTSRNFKFWSLVSLVVALLTATGCVRRTVTIHTDPQGARIILNDEEVGTSPVSVDFTWYGDYDVTIRHEGYETLHTHQRLNAPWYQIPPIDFFAEAFVPFTIHDRHQMFFTLETRKPIDKTELVGDAVEMRQRTLYGSE